MNTAPHSHELWLGPGTYDGRPLPLSLRDYSRRAFTVGVGGPVGSGKTALMLALCRRLRQTTSLAAVTNDIFTRANFSFATPPCQPSASSRSKPAAVPMPRSARISPPTCWPWNSFRNSTSPTFC